MRGEPAVPDGGPLTRAGRTQWLLERLARVEPGQREPLLDELVTINMGVADAVVSRYRNRGVPTDDLRQVAYMALVRAARRFEADSGHDFLSYAVPTMRGEIRRYFRDQGWMVRPPRRIQELQQRLRTAQSALQVSLSREATVDELADETGAPIGDVTEALQGQGCFTPASLDTLVGDEETTLGERLGGDDSGLALADTRLLLGPAVRGLGERDRRIVMLRFYRGLTQQEIADDIGVTQMQVSRLLQRILTRLRQAIATGEPA